MVSDDTRRQAVAAVLAAVDAVTNARMAILAGDDVDGAELERAGDAVEGLLDNLRAEWRIVTWGWVADNVTTFPVLARDWSTDIVVQSVRRDGDDIFVYSHAFTGVYVVGGDRKVRIRELDADGAGRYVGDAARLLVEREWTESHHHLTRGDGR